MINTKRSVLVVGTLMLLTIMGIFTFNQWSKGQSKGQIAGITDVTSQSIKGVVLPHHELAQPLLVQAMNTLAANLSPSTIIVLSPNHFAPASPLAISGTKLKNFPLDQTVIHTLSTQNHLVIQDNLIDQEHGLFIPMEYLFATYPQALFIPVMISPLNYSETAINTLAAAIVKAVPTNTFFVVSTDFAHNLQAESALSHNQIVINIISHFNTPELLQLDDQYLDAPVAMALLLKIMQLVNATSFEVWQSSHGAVLLNQPLVQSTSYVTGGFYAPVTEVLE